MRHGHHHRSRDPLLDRHGRRAVDADQLGPDPVPVGGAQVPAADGAVSDFFDRDARGRTGLSIAVAIPPLPHLAFVDAEALGELDSGQLRPGFQVLIDVHGRAFS